MVLQSQRDCVLQPRVAESARLPWVSVRAIFNPNDNAPLHHRAATPLGLADTPRFSQGSSRLATLWDGIPLGFSAGISESQGLKSWRHWTTSLRYVTAVAARGT